MGYFMKSAGAGVPSADRITLLRDADGDGNAEYHSPFLPDLHSPFGMALIGDTLYVANTDAIWAFPYRSGATAIDKPGQKVIDLPAGTINHHWTKNLLASPDGTRLYVTVGSNSNVAENGIEHEAQRAAILEVDLATHRSRVFASGSAQSERARVARRCVVDRGERTRRTRQRSGTGLPDIGRDGGFYGWPYSYTGSTSMNACGRRAPISSRPRAYRTTRSARTRPRSASPSLRATSSAPDYASGAFISQHGSWNRNPPSGYRVVFVSFEREQTGRHTEGRAGWISERTRRGTRTIR